MSEILTPEIIQKYSKKKLGWLIAETQKRVNKFVRLRDSEGEYFRCISCNKVKHIYQLNAGHYLNVGDHSSVRFNLDNIHGQCVYCNCTLNGNGKKYLPNLVKKIGFEKVEELRKTALIPNFKWDRLMLIYILEKFKEYQ